MLVLTDLLDPSAARPLVEAMPVLARRHHVVVASATDPQLEALLDAEPARPLDVHRAVAAAEMLDARERAARSLRAAGAVVIEAAPHQLGAACVKRTSAQRPEPASDPPVDEKFHSFHTRRVRKGVPRGRSSSFAPRRRGETSRARDYGSASRLAQPAKPRHASRSQ